MRCVFADGLKRVVDSRLGNVRYLNYVGRGLAKNDQSGQDDSTSKIRQGNTIKAGLKCVSWPSLNAGSIVNKKNLLNMVILTLI